MSHDWGSFETEFAAELFSVNLIAEALNRNPSKACCSGSAFDYWEIAGRLLKIIENHDGDARDLATTIAEKEPWNLGTAPDTDNVVEDIPF